MPQLFTSRTGIFLTGLLIGVIAALLQLLGNPANMGICVACFERDIAGALGLHRAAVVQYLRPEIIGLVIGALGASLVAREFRPRGGSAPIVRFVLGFCAMIGALVFLGCPWRAVLRLAGGDANAIIGIAGMACGVWLGIRCMRAGYSLGRSRPASQIAGLVLPLTLLGMLALQLCNFTAPGGALFASSTGPGAMHAALPVSLSAGILIGILAQRSRFCTMGAIRDVLLIRDYHLLTGVTGLLLGALATNLLSGQFHPGLIDQPVAHTSQLWNFLGMLLAGLAFALAGGCPGRQLFMAGEGDGDAAMCVLGMIAGAAVAHNFATASSPAGPGAYGPAAVIVCLAICMVIGFTMRRIA